MTHAIKMCSSAFIAPENCAITRVSGRSAGDFLWETPEEQLRGWVGVAE